MKPKLIIFDLFGTLVFSVEKLKREDFFAFYQKLGIKFKTEKDIKLFTSLFAQLMTQSAGWQDFSQKLLEKVIKQTDQKIINKLANFFKENIVYRLYDDAKEIIAFPYQKAILTSAAPFLFSSLGLEKYFEIFTPRETKFLKPDPRAFLAVLEKLKVKPEETLMIGDELERDLIPAKKLEMETILIDRGDKLENTPVKKIGSLIELKQILMGR
ncbi:MAG: HAD family hydrolase [Candidatus Nealsonbacteria bacterium]|nr:MAG: HAD family hydrolase [Candidatus Nealsonbacteria bacterium]